MGLFQRIHTGLSVQCQSPDVAELDPQNGQLGKIVAIDLQSGGQFILSQLSSHPQLADPAANDIFLLTGGYLSHKNS